MGSVPNNGDEGGYYLPQEGDALQSEGFEDGDDRFDNRRMVLGQRSVSENVLE